MSERIDTIQYDDVTTPTSTSLFLDGPTEFLVRGIVETLREDTVWSQLFGDSIDLYRRQDYSIRQLPALRVYNETYVKEFESWFVSGDIKCDLILPASIRREETQQLQDTLSAALLQQFRRVTFFNTVSARVPGLNELGKMFNVDKSLGFEWNETVVPLTQITVNFRLDLRQWDLHLEQTSRTKDQPFEKSLGDLKRLRTEIDALRDTLDKELSIEFDNDY